MADTIFQHKIPANMRRWTNVDLKLAQSRRRWANIKSTLVQFSCFLRGELLYLQWTTIHSGYYWLRIILHRDHDVSTVYVMCDSDSVDLWLSNLSTNSDYCTWDTQIVSEQIHCLMTFTCWILLEQILYLMNIMYCKSIHLYHIRIRIILYLFFCMPTLILYSYSDTWNDI